MVDFSQTIASQKELSPEQQKHLGQSTAAKMDNEHEQFLKVILHLIDTKEIDVLHPESLLKKETYDTLSEEWKSKVDLALVNIVNLLSHIIDFRVSTHTPDESPELQSMIDHLWQMKQRIEEHYDVFKF
ncbi:MAG: hypothetical protein PHI23_03410 [Candidatus Peribacteraceae bacterium]|nr:hypothetical protein [Candidatus Peribacteraceae bacterium]